MLFLHFRNSCLKVLNNIRDMSTDGNYYREKSNTTNLFILTYKIYHQGFVYLHVNCVVLTFRNEWIFDSTQKGQDNTMAICYINKEYVKNLTQKFLYKKISTEIQKTVFYHYSSMFYISIEFYVNCDFFLSRDLDFFAQSTTPFRYYSHYSYEKYYIAKQTYPKYPA